jgi:hypothetical protein
MEYMASAENSSRIEIRFITFTPEKNGSQQLSWLPHRDWVGIPSKLD